MGRIGNIVLFGLVLAVTSSPADALSRASREALHRALDDERKAEAIYLAVIAELGEVRPFSRIVVAEARHQSHLVRLFERHGVEVPVNPWKPEAIDVPATRTEACAMAVAAEVANVGLYDELLEGVEEPDIRKVFTMLSDASDLRHLPAFERCAGAGGGPGSGRGAQTRPSPGAGAGSGCCGCVGGK